MTTLKELFAQASHLLERADLTEAKVQLQAAQARLEAPGVNILLTGDYNRGKSSLLNALLGEDLFAVSSVRLPVINIIRFGDQRTAQIVRDGTVQTTTLPEVRSVKGADQIIIQWDQHLVPNSQQITEYPSMVEPPDNHLADCVGEADLIVIVVACDALYSNVEAEQIEGLIKAAGHRELTFVANFYDRIATKDRDEVRKIALVQLPANEEGIFFLSAQKALEQESASVAMLDQVKQRLASLSVDASALKEARVLTLLKRAVAELETSVENVAAQADEKHARTKAKTEAIRSEWEDFAQLHLKIKRDLDRYRANLRDVLQAKIGAFLRRLALDVESAGQAYTGADLREHLEQKIRNELESFRAQELGPTLDEQTADGKRLLTQSLKAYEASIRAIYHDLPQPMPNLNVTIGDQTLSFSSRLGEVEIDEETMHQTEKAPLSLVRLVEVPEALATLVGTAVLSMVLNQYAIFLLPAGVSLAAYLGLRGNRSKTETAQMMISEKYAGKIREQAAAVDVEIINYLNETVARLHDELVTQLDTIQRQVRNDVNQELSDLQNDSLGGANALRSELSTFRAKLDAFMTA